MCSMFNTMLLRLFKNISMCVSVPPKVMRFGESNTDATTYLESPSNTRLMFVSILYFWNYAFKHISNHVICRKYCIQLNSFSIV